MKISGTENKRIKVILYSVQCYAFINYVYYVLSCSVS